MANHESHRATRRSSLSLSAITMAILVASASACTSPTFAPRDAAIVDADSEVDTGVDSGFDAGNGMDAGHTPIAKVDLVFLVDNSNSMASEQRKLRAEFPEIIYALTTGDTNHDGDLNDPDDGPPIESLRIAVITSDMGVLGAGNGTLSLLQNCGAGPANHQAGGGFAQSQFEDSHYGDDGKFQLGGHSIVADPPTVPVGVDCDVDGNSGDDAVPPGGVTLANYLTFSSTGSTTTFEYVRRVSCLANVGVSGCVFEMQLEAMLKAITLSAVTPEGGPFHAAPGEEATRGVGHGDDAYNHPAPGWFREDSVLALVMVTDEDDCSATTPEMFNFASTVPPFDEDSANQATAVARSQTRCSRFEAAGLWPVTRFVNGFLARRALNPNAFVFAAITGVPPDLTDEVLGTPTVPIVEGADNLQSILDDGRMAYTYLPVASVPSATLGYACQHFDRDLTVIAQGTASNSTTITGVSVAFAPGAANKSATVALAYPSGTKGAPNVMPSYPLGQEPIDITMDTAGQVPEPGMTVSGTGIAAGTVIVTAYTKGAGYSITLSQATTGAGTMGGSITIGAAYGPAVGHFIVNATDDGSLARITGVTGTGPYTVTVDTAVTFTPSDTITIRPRDVEAVPARRIARVAQGLHDAPQNSNAILQSICVDTFRPAIRRIVSTIQSNL